MTLVGFKRMTIGIHDENGLVTDKYVVEGKQDEGATTTANITGLAAEAVRVSGSDITYYISQKGTGAVAADFGLLDLPGEVSDKILGYRQTESGLSFVGKSTEPPYCSVMLESSDLSGETALLGFFKGKFRKEAINLQTLDPDTPFTPEAETYILSAINDDKPGESFEEVVGKYVGTDEAAITELTALVFPEAVPGG